MQTHNWNSEAVEGRQETGWEEASQRCATQIQSEMVVDVL